MITLDDAGNSDRMVGHLGTAVSIVSDPMHPTA